MLNCSRLSLRKPLNHMNIKELETNYCAYVSKTQWTEIITAKLLGLYESDVLGHL